MTAIQISMALTIGSLLLGVGAWVLAAFAITASKANTSHRNTALSFSFCAISLVFQLFEVGNRVNINDYAAIEDTIRAVLIASVALTVITIVLNAAAVVKVKRKEANHS